MEQKPKYVYDTIKEGYGLSNIARRWLGSPKKWVDLDVRRRFEWVSIIKIANPSTLPIGTKVRILII